MAQGKQRNERDIYSFFVYLECEEWLVALLLSGPLARPARVAATAKCPKGIRRRRARGIRLDLSSEVVSESEVAKVTERVDSVLPVSDESSELSVLRIRSSLPARVGKRVRLCRTRRRRIWPIRRRRRR